MIRIGDVIFDVAKPCSRCIFTTVSPEKGQKHSSGEPLATLQTFRTASDNGDVDFGQNLIARNSGVVRVGDEVEILSTGPARVYGAADTDDIPDAAPQADASVSIDWQGQAFRGNNQQVLLEQLENQWNSHTLFLSGGDLRLLSYHIAGRRSDSAEKVRAGPGRHNSEL